MPSTSLHMVVVCACIAHVQAEELAKQQKFVEATRDIHRHMIEQMREKEELRREQADLDQHLLKQRIIQDQKVIRVGENNWRGSW